MYLIRGLPGSGKSTLAVHLLGALGARWYEADMWMKDSDGESKFDPANLASARALS